MPKRRNKRVYLNLQWVMVFCALLSFFTRAPASAWDTNALDKFVLLLIKTEGPQSSRSFFDLLELGDELLVPVNRGGPS